MLAPGAIVDPEDLRIPGEQPGSPMVILDDLGSLPHGHRYRARQGKSLLLLTVLTPEVIMQRELRDLLAHQVVLAGEVAHPNLLPTYGTVRLPLGDDFDTYFLVRPDPGCPTLRQWLHEVWQAGHALDPLNAVAIAVQVCEALGALHDKYAHGYVTADNVFMYPTGGMPQALLSATAEGPLLPFAPEFEAFVEAGYLPMAGRELFESPHLPRIETDVLGVAGLVLEILTGQALVPGMALDRFGLPPRLERVLEVASREDPEERPQDILMFSRRLQAAVGLGEDPVEPSAVLEPVHHGDHADPRYPAVRAKPWRPPPPPPPPWANEGPTPGSGAWNVGAPTPGSGAWNVGSGVVAVVGGSGAWAMPGSGAWSLAGGPSQIPTQIPTQGPPVPPPPHHAGHGSGPHPGANHGSGAWATPSNPSTARWESSGPVAQPQAPLGRDFPIHGDPSGDDLDPGATAVGRQRGSTQLFGSNPSPPPPVRLAPGTGASSHSVSIMMPAPDGSVMAPLSRGPANYIIIRNGKRHGPYDLGQLERLIPMGKLRSVDAIEVPSTGQQLLAVDLPGLRPLFEERAKAEDHSVVRPMPVPVQVASPAPADSRGTLWAIVGVLAFALVAVAAVLALR